VVFCVHCFRDLWKKDEKAVALCSWCIVFLFVKVGSRTPGKALIMLKFIGGSLKTMLYVVVFVAAAEFTTEKASLPSPTKTIVCWGLDQAKDWLSEKPEQTAVAEAEAPAAEKKAGAELAVEMSKVVQSYDANTAEYVLTAAPAVVAAPPASTNFKDYLLYGLLFMAVTGISAKTLLSATASGAGRLVAKVGAWRERRTILGLGDFNRLSSLIESGKWLTGSERTEMTQLVRLKNMAANGIMLSEIEKAEQARLATRAKSLANSTLAFWANRIDAFLNRDTKLATSERESLRKLAESARAQASKV
jgi:hypothetical protein